jgi:hypothetical protein
VMISDSPAEARLGSRKLELSRDADGLISAIAKQPGGAVGFHVGAPGIARAEDFQNRKFAPSAKPPKLTLSISLSPLWL